MAQEETINVEIYKPTYPIGQEVYVPGKNRVTETKVVGYEVQVIEQEGNPVGVVSNYRLQQLVSVRRGAESDLVDYVKDCDFYVERSKAEAASKFLEVNADNETWRLAVGDRDVKDEDSPYSIENCGLPACCANISEARDILLYCKHEGGLLAHDRDTLAELITGHGLEYDGGSPIGRIFGQLGIE